MVLFFSGTGNSHYAAKMIAEQLDDKLMSLNDRIRNKDNSTLESAKPFVIVTPTYGWRIPQVVDAYIRSTRFKGCDKIYFVMTCGGDIGYAEKYLEKTCKEIGLKFMGVKAVKMPENYIAMFDVPDKKTADKIILDAGPEINKISASIKSGEKLTQEISSFGRTKSSMINQLFITFEVKDNSFKSDDSCIKCRKCVNICPVGNITFENEKPNWNHKCIHCMACISVCPERAIEYANKSKKRNRHYLEVK